jgi:hypothetical protein
MKLKSAQESVKNLMHLRATKILRPITSRAGSEKCTRVPRRPSAFARCAAWMLCMFNHAADDKSIDRAFVEHRMQLNTPADTCLTCHQIRSACH